jgi:futalosine hydrolase
MRVLVVTAVEAERLAVARGLGDRADVLIGGVGMAAAAASTARALAAARYDLVLSAGIAGGFDGRAGLGTTVVASRSVAADLGAESPDGFIPLDTLGFGASTVDSDAGALDLLRRALPAATVGDVLTVATVTGTAQRAAALLARYPAAAAEAMEGFGVATAAAQAGAAYAELRTISNAVGPRQRVAWRIGEALTALEEAAARVAASLDA